MEAAGKGGKAAYRKRPKKNRNTVHSPKGLLGDNPEDCPVCLTGFDDTMHRPRTLPCGHTICTLCIDKLKEQDCVTCPECRVSHTFPEGGQFPVCYTLEAVIRRLRDTEMRAVAVSLSHSARKGKEASTASGKKEAVGPSKKMCSFLLEQEAAVVSAITACRELQSQLDEYQTTLTGWGERQQQLEDRLQGLMDQSRSARELVQQEESRAAAKEEEVKKTEQELQAVQEMLRTPATEQEAGMVVAEVFRCTGEAEQVVEECQKCFPDASTVATVTKVREATSAALEAAQAIHATIETPPVTTEELWPQSDPDLRAQPDPGFTIMDRLQVISAMSLKRGPLQAEDLRSLTQPTRSLVQAGRVFAVHQVEGQQRHAKITLNAKDGRLYLHALEEHTLPLGAATLQVSEAVPLSLPCTVFLDLSWPGCAPRRVHIRLSPNITQSMKVLLLCTGQCGPSYRDTKLFDVHNKGEPGESVWTRKFEINDVDPSGLVPALHEYEFQAYRYSGRAGAVCDNGFGLFGIITMDSQNSYDYEDDYGYEDKYCYEYSHNNVFGEVVEGLHVVAEAAHHSNIMEVTVADCGVVL